MKSPIPMFLNRPSAARDSTDAPYIASAGDPRCMEDWGELASTGSHYSTAHWLHFSDMLGKPRSQYWTLRRGGCAAAALSTHWWPEEVSKDYTAHRMVHTPHSEEPVLTLGGRRGFLSSVLLCPSLDDHQQADALGELMRTGLDAVPEAGGRWWWPYLRSDDLGMVTRAALRAFGHPPGLHFVGADCAIPLVGRSLEEHVASLPGTQRRTNFRREQRRFAESCLRIERLALSDTYERLGPMLANVQQKYGQPQTAAEMTEVLSLHVVLMHEHAVVFGCLAEDRLIGFSLCYRWGQTLTVRALGFDYDHLVGADEYGIVAIHAPLRYCYEEGLRQLHLGIDSYPAKIRRGAVPRPLWALSSWSGHSPEVASTEIERFVGQIPNHEAAGFRHEILEGFRLWHNAASSAFVG
jgi:hypothetical protein